MAPTNSPAGRGQPTVLIVDDTPDIRRLIAVLLTTSGHQVEVLEAEDGAAALRLVAAHSPDVVILDLGLPVLDGMTVIPLIRQQSPSTQVVVFTAESAPSMKARALNAGATAYYEKTVAHGALIEKVGRLLDQAVGVIDLNQSDTPCPHPS